ncbi:hypothetical protein [Pseudoxanthomonas sacheonensis]|uniref:Uncharacterized protein n=1 Tax=Pseudoxanthomonas sacheonensis TaxID=443615 RepID=A0ABU1RTX3_9GAMM|nr:hypothetical protein [Pseudoxanthomonas sacheonensis]MDR6842212.1 hypothetical protein [Pseudoxanthomonas sacheonensis]
MKFYPPEPLTPEERELAQLTAQLGPQGEPSTALDARILAAAHAALDRKQPSRRKPRWPVAMGLAASVIFAVGIAWQLRPLQQAPVLASAEAPMPAAAAEPEAVMADSAPGSPSVPPEAAMADDKAAAAAAAPAYEEAAQAPPPVKNLAPPSEQRVDRPRQIDRSATRASEPSRRQAQVAGNLGAGAPPPPAPPAPAAMAAAAPAAEPSVSFAPDPHDAYSYSARDAAADSAVPNAGLLAEKPRAEALAEAKAARANASARQKEGASLDRIEVTGSRLKRTDLQVPVSDDAQLPVNEWLERVRTRYGLGDAGAAKQSLLLFVKDHPSEPVPGDLEPLLEE